MLLRGLVFCQGHNLPLSFQFASGLIRFQVTRTSVSFLQLQDGDMKRTSSVLDGITHFVLIISNSNLLSKEH